MMLHSLICNKTTGVLSVAATFAYVYFNYYWFVVLSHDFQDFIENMSCLPM